MAGNKNSGAKNNPKSLENLKKFGAPGGNKPMNGDHDYGYERWSIRGAQRHIAAQEVNPADPNALTTLLQGGARKKRKPTIAELIAAKQLAKAMAGDNQAINSVTDNVDGRLPETLFTPDQKRVEKITLEFVDAPKRTDPEKS